MPWDVFWTWTAQAFVLWIFFLLVWLSVVELRKSNKKDE